MKKKIAVLLTFVLIIGLSVAGTSSHKKAYAKEAQMYLEIPESVKKENEFTVNVILNSDVDLYSVDAYLSYNADSLEFVPEGDKVTGAAGVLEIKDVYEQETKNAAYELTFKALETGETEIALTDVFLIDYVDLDYIEVVPSAKKFEIGINKKVAADARLSELIVAPGDLTEPFSPDCLEYEMYVGMEVEMLGISAFPMEEGSVVGLEMPEKLQAGENIVIVTVTALSGNINTYTIKVYRGEVMQPEESTENMDGSEEEQQPENKEESAVTTENSEATATRESVTETGTQEYSSEYVTPDSTETP